MCVGGIAVRGMMLVSANETLKKMSFWTGEFYNGNSCLILAPD